MTAIYMAIALFAHPFLAKLFPSYTLARDSRPNLKPEMEFGAVEFTEPSLVWYFRDHIHGFMTPLKRKDAAEFMSRAWIAVYGVANKHRCRNFSEHRRIVAEISARRGFNVAKGSARRSDNVAQARVVTRTVNVALPT